MFCVYFRRTSNISLQFFFLVFIRKRQKSRTKAKIVFSFLIYRLKIYRRWKKCKYWIEKKSSSDLKIMKSRAKHGKVRWLMTWLQQKQQLLLTVIWHQNKILKTLIALNQFLTTYLPERPIENIVIVDRVIFHNLQTSLGMGDLRER